MTRDARDGDGMDRGAGDRGADDGGGVDRGGEDGGGVGRDGAETQAGERDGTSGSGGWGRVVGWMTEAVPRGRIAAFRTLVYLFVAADLVVFTPWVRDHASTPGDLYRPLLVGRVLPLPVPTSLLVHSIFWVLGRVRAVLRVDGHRDELRQSRS
jgi:hypothetical protein